MSDVPRYVTKHCKPADRDRLLQGRFKIGCHSEYGSGKTSLTADPDGVGAVNLMGDVSRFSWTHPQTGALLVNVGVFGMTGPAVSVDTSVNLNIFCCSAGPYDARRHQLLLNGSGEYVGDPSITAYVVLDAFQLHQAFGATMNVLFGGADVIAWYVHYTGRDTTLADEQAFAAIMATDLADAALRSAFGKPAKYSLEEEFRWVFEPLNGVPIANIFTINLSENIQKAYREAIVTTDLQGAWLCRD